MTTRNTLSLNSSNLPAFVEMLGDRFIGLDGMYDQFSTAAKTSNYPPYNLMRTGDDSYEIIMAVAGFSKEEIDIQVVDRELTIAGQKIHDELEEGVEFLHQGLAMRDFERSFKLVEYIVVQGATLEDGLLRIKLIRELPESAKPKQIKIG